jgi:two-component system OmpR family response regulator
MSAQLEQVGTFGSLNHEARLEVADLVLDSQGKMVWRSGQKIVFAPRERGLFSLLEYLMRCSGDVVTRAELLDAVWHRHHSPYTNVVDVAIWRLRQLVDRPYQTKLIHTVRNVGYILSAERPAQLR